jgi:hypothetical protein
VVSYPIEGNIAGQHPHETDRKRDPPPENVLVGQDPAGHDRELLGDGNPEAGDEKNQEQTQVTELLDERGDQIAPRAKIRFPEDGDTSVYSDSPVRSEGALPWR